MSNLLDSAYLVMPEVKEALYSDNTANLCIYIIKFTLKSYWSNFYDQSYINKQ